MKEVKMKNSLNQYRARTNKVSDNLRAELIKQEINWHTIELLGRELVILARNARVEQVRERQEHILSKYEEV